MADREAREKKTEEEAMAKIDGVDLSTEEGLKVAAQVLGESISEISIPSPIFVALNLCIPSPPSPFASLACLPSVTVLRAST